MRFKSPLTSTPAGRVFVTSAILIFAVFAFALFSGFSSRVQAVSTNVVISEFRVRGPNGGNDEFVELYNLSGAPVAIGGWEIRGINNAPSGCHRAGIISGTGLSFRLPLPLSNSSSGRF